MEIDSDLHHTSVLDALTDARRDDSLRAAGHAVVRIDERQVWYRPDEVVSQLRVAL